MENFKEFFGLRPPVNVTREALRERLIRCTSEVSASLQRGSLLLQLAASCVVLSPPSLLQMRRQGMLIRARMLEQQQAQLHHQQGSGT